MPWTSFRRSALVLFGAALLAGFGSTALYMGQRMPADTWRPVFVLALVVLTVTSSVLVPGVLLPDPASPRPEFLSDDLRDEWDDLRQRTVARPHVLVLGGAASALTYAWFVLYYGKATNAIWFGWLPVGAAALGLSLLLFGCARRTAWYNDRFYRTPTWVILVAFAGFATAQFLGVFMTEQAVAPRGGGAETSAADDIDYWYVGTRAYRITGQYLEIGPVPDIGIPDCESDECAYVVLAVLVVVLVLVLVVGAALVPHMWVLSCLVLLTLIALLALHDVRRDRGLRARYGRAARGPGEGG
jgi:MFS family permease